ncbi:hypothetical protein NIE88_12655 [Sporolactobacillus shoreicorticis]|uniref:RDRP core domain-containing protein n=1 Tax=Sporolactobacillus shoreicorticis TaxID=1923877 RepID=A0ABW5S6W9_9BACL|nr:hypothetical protein [Sporolactobacillus shoreicorticis]MCO7126615.1 hypothetical protein [Sporolactobacillus shoreicorticis]
MKHNKTEILLNDQIFLLSVDSMAFFTDKEKWLFYLQNEFKHMNEGKNNMDLRVCDYYGQIDAEKFKKKLSKAYGKYRKLLLKKFGELTNTRQIRKDYLCYLDKRDKHFHLRKSNIISMFDGILTRLIGCQKGQITKELIIVKNFYYPVMEQLIHNGFDFGNIHYRYLSSGSGQIKEHKMMFIRESTYNKIKNRLMCGLTIDEINRKGGVNPNKLNSYLSLAASASAPWEDFPINDVLVVPDYSTNVTDAFDFIDKVEKTRKVKDSNGKIKEEKFLQLSEDINKNNEMTVPVESFDGFGIVDPEIADKISDIFIFRAPWCKGLLASVPFMDYFDNLPEAKSGHLIVKDAWGDDYDILKNKPKIIMTDSQLKMRKYYDSLDDFKKRFNDNNCLAGIASVNDIRNRVNLNYQFLQTLDLTDDELNELIKPLKDTIRKINVGDNETMLKVIGATQDQKEIKDSHIKAVSLYHNLLRDPFIKKLVTDTKAAMIKDVLGGTFKIDGYRNVFILPDVVNFMSQIVYDEEHAEFAIEKNQVIFDKYKPGTTVDVLRSPHLYVEHALQTVSRVEEKYKKYFCGDGLYISSKSSTSLLIMCDYDGDHVSVTNNNILIGAAKRKIKECDIHPLYYEMFSSDPVPINNEVIGENLKVAYGQNIGIISNAISKILNGEKPDMDAVRLLTAKNNFTIDFAKTLTNVELPEKAKKYLNNKVKLPHFFKYAKDKKESQMVRRNESTVNRIERLMKDPEGTKDKDKIYRNIAFRDSVPMYEYQKMISKNRRWNDEAAIKIRKKYDAANKQKLKSMPKDGEDHTAKYFCNKLKNELIKTVEDNKKNYSDVDAEKYACDILVKYLYGDKKSKSKDTLWKMFGNQIVENIICYQKTHMKCLRCGKEIEKNKNRKYCDDCNKLVTAENKKKSRRKKQLMGA